MAASLRTILPSRTAYRICSRCLSSTTRRAIPSRVITGNAPIHQSSIVRRTSNHLVLRRTFTSSPSHLASSPTANEAMERIEELYENATEEFQIAAEETEGNTVYASDDRDAARAEVDKLQEFYKGVVEGTGYEQDVRAEVKKRAGGRIRELANAMEALEAKAIEHD